MEKLNFNVLTKAVLLLASIMCSCAFCVAVDHDIKENTYQNNQTIPIQKHNVTHKKNSDEALQITDNDDITSNQDILGQLIKNTNINADRFKKTFSKEQLKKHSSACITAGVIVALFIVSLGTKLGYDKYKQKKDSTRYQQKNSLENK